MRANAHPAPQVRCRTIEDDDIASIIELLCRGFPNRPRHYWVMGLQRMAARALSGFPRYGFMMESGGRPVGMILLLYTFSGPTEDTHIRCNLSSWYVEPAFRPHATSLVRFALRDKSVTYLNISAAPHTRQTITALGFQQYASGVFLGLTSLRPAVPGSRIHHIGATTEAAIRDIPERDLLLDHASMGCASLVVENPDGLHPFVFQPFRFRSGGMRPPVRQLIYCRSIDDYLKFAGPLGRYMLARGVPLVLHDANGAPPGFLGRFFEGIGPKYFRGPDRPRLGDLAYTERVVFGP